MQIGPTIWVMLGGAIGAGARFKLGTIMASYMENNISHWANGAWPFSTFLTNILGGLFMGAFIGFFGTRNIDTSIWRPFLAIGILGGFTTFSTFTWELSTMIERGAYIMGVAYAAGSITLSLLAFLLGIFLIRLLA